MVAGLLAGALAYVAVRIIANGLGWNNFPRRPWLVWKLFPLFFIGLLAILLSAGVL